MKKIVALILVLIMSLSCFSLIGFAEGTETTEHLTEVPEGYIGVYTIEDLYCVRNDLTANYILMNDIDLSEATAEGGDWNYGGRGWNPIGSDDVYSNTAFSGTFDGNGYSVRGMNILISEEIPEGTTGSSYAGLFAYSTGTIKNLTLYSEIAINNTKISYIGAIVGKNDGIVENCISCANMNPTISADSYSSYVNKDIGNITGYNNGTIKGCASIGDFNINIAAHPSRSKGNVECKTRFGGICGYNNGTVEKCYNAATFDFNVSATTYYRATSAKTYDYSGEAYIYFSGICGNSGTYAKIENCYNTGNFVGEMEATQGDNSRRGVIYGYTSGISYYGQISNCYSIGSINTTISGSGYIEKVDYAISSSSVTICYYPTDIATGCTGATSLTEAQMKLQSMYSGWDFDTVWTMNGREDYPYPELRDVPLVLPEDPTHKHEYSSEVTKEATHLEEGETTYTCECGDTYTEVIKKLEGHIYTLEITKEATHLEEGKTTYTCECGDTYTEPIAKLETHIYEATVTKPTCTAKGFTTYTCACGDSYVSDYVGVSEHSYSSTVSRPATHLAEGIRVYTCSSCGDTYTENIAKTKEHSYFVSNVIAPTCEKEGYTVYSCECGDRYDGDKVSAKGHDYKGDTCKNCGETKVVNCSCNCHKGGISGFFFKIINFFQKLFGMNKTCACGAAH